MTPHPVVLEGDIVRLEPLEAAHSAPLAEVGLDPSLWKWTIVFISNPAEMQRYVQDALHAQSAGAAIPFATVERSSGRVVGSTRFLNIDRANRRVEIGSTWIAPAWQRTAVNTEAKYLMLRHAFETLGCIRVELKTDALNVKSRNAMLRIGAKEEGVLRQHMICYGGRIRDSVYFSILDAEWPDVKVRLEQMLGH
jgi:N-acetyltransferase